MAGDEDIDGVVLAWLVLQESAEGGADTTCGCLVVEEDHHLVGRYGTSARTCKEGMEKFRVGIGVLKPKIMGQALEFGDADDQSERLARTRFRSLKQS